MVVVAISGLHGAGKTTAAKILAEKLGLRYISAGMMFRDMAKEKDMSLEEFSRYVEENPDIDREIDKRSAEAAKSENVLIDARLAGWMTEGADIKILLTAPIEERVERIAQRESREIDDVMKETLAREKSETKRYKDVYGIDISDRSVFDLVMDTKDIDAEGVVKEIERKVNSIIEKKG